MQSQISSNGGHWYKAASAKIKDEQDIWVERVCARSTMCDASCLIYHNETEVIEATHGARKGQGMYQDVANANSQTNLPLKKSNEKIIAHAVKDTHTKEQRTFEGNKLGNIGSSVAIAEDTGKAEFFGKENYVSFWQTNYLSGNQGGCVVEFMFGSDGLVTPIEELTFKIRVLDKNGKNLGVGSFKLLESLGGSRADNYKTAVFNGIRIPNPSKEDGDVSPLCWKGVTVVFDEATGKQDGKKVELVRNNQFRYTTRKSVNVRVK
jgi:hypothetical protein